MNEPAPPAPPSVPADAPSIRSATLKARLFWCGRLLVGAALISLVLRRGGAAPLQRVLHTVSFPILLGSAAFYLAGQVLSAWKWQLLLRARGVAVPLGECCRLYLIGMFWNLWMPTNIGGDAVRAYLAAPRAGSRTTAAASILVERLTGFLALLLLAIAGLFWDASRHAGANSAALRVIIATVLLFALLFAGLATLHRTTTRTAAKPAGKALRKFGQVTEALAFYLNREQRIVLLWAMLLSLFFQASQIILNIILAAVVGLTVPASAFWWLVPVLALASLVPLGIGGLGVREAAAVTLLQSSGLALGSHTATIVGWSLLWQATVWLSSLPGAVWALKLPKPSAQQSKEPS